MNWNELHWILCDNMIEKINIKCVYFDRSHEIANYVDYCKQIHNLQMSSADNEKKKTVYKPALRLNQLGWTLFLESTTYFYFLLFPSFKIRFLQIQWQYLIPFVASSVRNIAKKLLTNFKLMQKYIQFTRLFNSNYQNIMKRSWMIQNWRNVIMNSPCAPKTQWIRPLRMETNPCERHINIDMATLSCAWPTNSMLHFFFVCLHRNFVLTYQIICKQKQNNTLFRFTMEKLFLLNELSKRKKNDKNNP